MGSSPRASLGENMRTDIETIIQNYWTELDTISVVITQENKERLILLLDKVPKLEDLYLTYRKNLYEIQDINAKITTETDQRKKAYLTYDKRKFQSLNNSLSAQVELIIFELTPVVI